MKKFKNALLIQTINSFIVGVLAIALPLMMYDKGIDIATMGLIFSILPITVQITRIVFGTLSDFFGRRAFFVMNGIMLIISNSIYYFSETVTHFFVGKITEGVKSSSLWSVNRAHILDHSKEKRKRLIFLRTCSSISMAIGRLVAGFLIVLLLFTNTILFCILIGLLVLPLAFSIKDVRRNNFNLKDAFDFMDFRKREKSFKVFLVLFALVGFSVGLIADYIFPMFLTENGFGAETIGVLLGLQLLLSGSLIYFWGRTKLRKLVLITGISALIILLPLGFSTGFSAAILVLCFGFVWGSFGSSQEGIFSKITKEDSYGSDIALLMLSFHAARTLSLSMSGFLISSFGFASVFVPSAIVFSIYSALAYKILK